ncbi:DGQHR domain-containing protein [Thioalkalivibrio sp. ALE31]|uniref:DGQHR domain-containing protein n=1 Tax=Thioalkalivibrio sp. ALE31 TaxID=1158182 RepID=UPI0009DA45CB|nr:DGQHR domain-containing protein [Thioalkalivibrio sp. ALE31]
MKETPKSITFPCLPVAQPIGEFYIGTIPAKDLRDITYFDVRRILKEKREIETYLGIQRELNKKRVAEIGQYVNTVDACFPTAVILAVPGVCAQFNADNNTMTLSNYLDPESDQEKVLFRQIAKVLDGQHRIEGLKDFSGDRFEVNISIFVDPDLSEQAYIFSTVNLAQTKVNKSLVYDLYDLAKSRSPQKVCHNIAVALDQAERSPFYKRIKRLGTATEGRERETITQATFVQALMPYISANPIEDRDLYMRNELPARARGDEESKLVFRNMMIDKRDLDIADVIFNYFSAIRERWPAAWNSAPQGNILAKTNGFRAFMRLLRPAYLLLTSPGGIPEKGEFARVIEKIDMHDEDFNVDNFKPGSSGESQLFRQIQELSGLSEQIRLPL